MFMFSSTEIDDMIRKSTNLLLTRTLSHCLQYAIKKKNVGLAEVRFFFFVSLPFVSVIICTHLCCSLLMSVSIQPQQWVSVWITGKLFLCNTIILSSCRYTPLVPFFSQSRCEITTVLVNTSRSDYLLLFL